MKKYLFILSILFLSNHIISQEITQQNIIGKWKVIKVLKKNKIDKIKRYCEKF